METGSTYYLELNMIMRDMLRRKGYDRILLENAAGGELELAAIQEAIERGAVGAILAAPRAMPDSAERLMGAEVSTVIVGGRPEELPEGISSVSVNNRSGVSAAVFHLRALGHDRIAYLRGRALAYSDEQRFGGFKAAMEASGEGVRDEYIVDLHEPSPGFAAGQQGARFLLNLSEPPTAIVAYNDAMAMGCLREAHERKLKVPEQLSVVGHDELRFAEFTVPPLATVRIDRHRLASQAVELLADRIRGEEPSSRSVEATFQIGPSIGPPT
jgi:DNA-binding LacI/PurR family transcriptional regulator